VLTRAMRDGVELMTWQQDTFAYAESYDEGAGRYRGLRAAQIVPLTADSPGLLVTPDVARAQIDAETQATPSTPSATPGGESSTPSPSGQPSGTQPTQPAKVTLGRYYGSVELDPSRVGRDASAIAEEVIAHLVAQHGANVRVTLEIEAQLPNGVSDQVVRTVTENGRSLKFKDHGFERE